VTVRFIIFACLAITCLAAPGFAASLADIVLFSNEDNPNVLDAGAQAASDTTDRTPVECIDGKGNVRGTMVLLIFGQSQAANSPPSVQKVEDTRFFPTRNVINFNVYDGRCYGARDPLLGATGLGGSIWSRLGESLIESGMAERVVLAPIAVGAATVADWAPADGARASGNLNRKLLVALRRLLDQKILPTHILWVQGGADRRQEPAYYRDTFMAIVRQIRSLDVSAPIYVALDTVCGQGWLARSKPEIAADPPSIVGTNTPDKILDLEWKRFLIREAQRKLVSREWNIRLGADMDYIFMHWRPDDCHWGNMGATLAVRMWLYALSE
jgi:hypothetical protein